MFNLISVDTVCFDVSLRIMALGEPSLTHVLVHSFTLSSPATAKPSDRFVGVNVTSEADTFSRPAAVLSDFQLETLSMVRPGVHPFSVG